MNNLHLNSGEIAFSDKPPVMMHTLVGVCVAVCLWDRAERRGGLCHYRLPQPHSLEPSKTPAAELLHDFGSEAIVALLKKFKRCGSLPSDLEARIVGGGDIHYGKYMQEQKIGERNIAVALKVLADFDIDVVGKAVGGSKGRQIRFNSASGDFAFRDIPMPNNTTRLPQSQSPLVRASQSHPMVKSGDTATSNNWKPPINTEAVKIRVLITDKSSTTRTQLKRKIEEDARFVVVAEAANCDESKLMIESKQPDLITLDIGANEDDWENFIGGYLKQQGKPVVIVASTNSVPPSAILTALKLGAFDHLDMASLANVHKVLKTAYQARKKVPGLEKSSGGAPAASPYLDKASCHSSLIVVGSSTGGVEALDIILKRLPAVTPPICVVQHIPKNFSHSLAERLNEICAVEVSEAEDGTELKDSHVYIAQGDRHMKLIQLITEKVIIRLSDEPERNGFRPSVDYLFNSTQKFTTRNIVAVLLTGMGRDGAEGLLTLKNSGAFTVAQNEATSVVWGMARAAEEIGAVCRSVPLKDIASVMLEGALKANRGEAQFRQQLARPGF